MSVASPLRELLRLLDELHDDKKKLYDQAVAIWKAALAGIDKDLMRAIDRFSFTFENDNECPNNNDVQRLRGMFRHACIMATGTQIGDIVSADADRNSDRQQRIMGLLPIAERSAQATRLIAPPERVHEALTNVRQTVVLLDGWRPGYSTDELFDQRLGSNPNSDGNGDFRNIISESSEHNWTQAVEAYAVARNQLLHIADVCEPIQKSITPNPYLELIQFVGSTIEKETNRLSSLRNRRDFITDFAAQVRPREDELNRLIDSAFAASRQTGFTMEVVEQRIRTLERICREALYWQRDAPKPDPLATHPDDPDPASGYLNPIYDRFVRCAPDVRALATAYQAGSANIIVMPIATTTPSTISTLTQVSPSNVETHLDESIDGEQHVIASNKPEVARNGQLKQPSDDAFKAYRVWTITGKSQIELARLLESEFKRNVSQGQVSRWLRDVKKWIEAGKVLPDIHGTHSNKPMPMDPAKIDLGPNREGRTKRQRRRADADD